MLKWIKKYWFYVSIAFTILSSILSGLWWVNSKFTDLVNKVNETNEWVQTHDDDLQTLHDDTLRLKEDERLREAGLLK